jgi:hypothetical protein
MKKTMKLSLWGALIVFANHLSATGMESSLDVNMVGSKAFELTMNNLRGEVKISLLNSNQHVIYKETYTNSADVSFKRTFDLGLFPNGKYTIELMDEEKSQSFPLLIVDNKLTVKTAEKAVHFLPAIHKKDNIVTVHMPALTDSYLAISILDENDVIVFETKIKGKGNIGKIFDFSKTDKGAYKFLLSSKAGLVSKEIWID